MTLPTFMSLTLRACPIIAALALAQIATPDPAHATDTEWTASLGDWSTAENWTNGEPTPECKAVIATGNATITLPGEVCSDLRVGPDGGGLSSLQITGGTLTVPGAVIVDRATVSHFSGTSIYGRLQVGGASTGAYSFGAGALTVDTIVLGGPTATGSFSASSGAFTVNDSTIINRFGSMTLNGFSVDMILGHVVVRGGFSVANGPRPIAADNLVMESSARTLVGLGPTTLSVVQVAGDVVIDGSIEIQDSQDIADGTFEFIRASSLTGGFTSEMFPSERWSWFVQDNSLFLRKGDSTPVRESTWGRIKAKRGDQPER